MLIVANIVCSPPSDEESDFVTAVKPAKKKAAAQPNVTDFFDSVPDAPPAKNKPVPRKISSSMKPKSPKQAKIAPKKKTVIDDSDDDMAIEEDDVPVRATIPKRAARAAPKKYVEIGSDSGDGGSDFDIDD